LTMPQEERDRIRSYLVTVANRLSIPELVEKVRQDVLPLREAALAVPAERFSERPAPGEWSAAEVLGHVLEMNEWGADAIEAVLEERPLPAPPSDEVGATARQLPESAEAFWAAFEPRREALLARVLRTEGNEHLDRKLRHPFFGDLSWREWLLFMRVHDLDHLRQVQAIARAFGAST
jgi:hypothetical protein